MSTPTHPVVSDDGEELILVDGNGNPVGFASKAECHRGEGLLHLAFSVFLFDSSGRLLLQRRSPDKPLWGGFWSNSCCSHPRRGETVEEAAHRRLREELGLDAGLEALFAFRYHAAFGEAGSERELCHVLAGRTGGPVRPNANEVADWRWVSPAELDREMEEHPDRFTPWFLLEWPRVRDWLERRRGGTDPPAEPGTTSTDPEARTPAP